MCDIPVAAEKHLPFGVKKENMILLIPECIYCQNKLLGSALKSKNIRNSIEFPPLINPPMCCFIPEYTVIHKTKYTLLPVSVSQELYSYLIGVLNYSKPQEE